MEYYAKFMTENVPKQLQTICEHEYLRIYNKFADESADCYKVWNAEYDRIFGHEDDYDNDRYNAWMADKICEHIREINDSKIMYFTVGKIDCDIIGHLYNMPETKVYFYFYKV